MSADQVAAELSYQEQVDKRRLKAAEGFRRYVDENWTMLELQAYLGLSGTTARRIFTNEMYSGVPRPEGLVRRTESERQRSIMKAALTKMKEEQWTKVQLQQYLGYCRASVNQLLSGRRYPGLLQEVGLTPVKRFVNPKPVKKKKKLGK